MLRLLPSKLLPSLLLFSSLTALHGCTDQAKEQQEKAALHAKSANAYYQQGQYRAAINEYNIALKGAPSVEYAVALADVYLDLSQAQAALNLLDPLSVKYPQATNKAIAEAYLQRGKYRSALELLEQQPTPSDTDEAKHQQLMLIQALIGSRQLDNGQLQINAYEQKFGQDADSQLLTLELAFNEQNASLASSIQKNLSDNFSDNAKVNNALGQIALKSNDLDAAERYFTAALGQLPKTDVMTSEKLLVLTRLSDTLTRKGRFTEAMIYSQLIAEARPDADSSQKEFNQAIDYIRQSDYAKAENILVELANRYPNADRINSLLGLVQLQQGDITKAGLLLEKSVDPETASPQLLRAAAQAQLQLSKPQQAVDLLEAALEQDPNNPELLALYGMSASRITGLEAKSELALKKISAQQPDNQRLRLALSQIYFRQGKIELGMSELKIGATKAGNDPIIAGAYVKTLIQQNQMATAESYINTLKTDHPKMSHPWQLSAGIAQQKGDLKQAEQLLKKAEQLEPNNTASLMAQAYLAQQQQQYQLAQDKFQQVLALEPNQAAALTGLLATSIKLNNQEQIKKQLNKQAEAGNQNALATLAQIDLFSKNMVDAASKSQKLAQLSEKLTNYSRGIGAQIERSLAQQAAQQKNLEAAITHLQQALVFEPGKTQLLAEIAELQYASNKPTEAEATLTQLRLRQGGLSVAAIVEASATAKTEPEKAIAILQASETIEPNSNAMALLYKLEKEFSPANSANTLQKWLQAYPNDIRPLLEVANNQLQQGKNKAAISSYEKIIAQQPKQVIALNNLAWLYGEAGELEKAMNFGEQAAQLAPNSASVLDTLGWIYHKAGDKRAVETLEKALELSPNDSAIQDHFNKAKLGS